MPLISFTTKGLFCEQAVVYIDPWGPVDRAIITHAHAVARSGMGAYWCQEQSVTPGGHGVVAPLDRLHSSAIVADEKVHLL